MAMGRIKLPSFETVVHIAIAEAIVNAIWFGITELATIQSPARDWGFVVLSALAIIIVGWYLRRRLQTQTQNALEPTEQTKKDPSIPYTPIASSRVLHGSPNIVPALNEELTVRLLNVWWDTSQRIFSSITAENAILFIAISLSARRDMQFNRALLYISGANVNHPLMLNLKQAIQSNCLMAFTLSKRLCSLEHEVQIALQFPDNNWWRSEPFIIYPVTQ